MIDSHAHINDDAFINDYDEVIKRAKESGISYILIPGWDIESSKKAIKIAEKYDGVYAAIGIHPENIDNLDINYLSILEELSKNPKVKAIGEIGLDYHYRVDNKHLQTEVLTSQLKLASKLKLPVVIHSRDCTEDMLHTLKAHVKSCGFNDKVGVMHSYSGSKETMNEYLKLGFYISFSGPVTFKNAPINKENALLCPLNKMLVETDSPYMTPEPYRGKRNEPAFVNYVIDQIAALKEKDRDMLSNSLLSNFIYLFNI